MIGVVVRILIIMSLYLVTRVHQVEGKRQLSKSVIGFAFSSFPPRPHFSGTSIGSRTIQRNQQRSLTSALSATLDEPILWAIRGTSAIASYIGFVAYLDRPQGQLNVNDNDIEIKESTVPGAGLGLFAKTSLNAKTVLGSYPGVVVPLKQNLDKLRQYPQCEGYIWRFTDNKMVIDPTNAVGDIEFNCIGGNPALPGSMWLFQNVFNFKVPTTLCRINEPPIGKDVNVVTNEDLSNRCVVFELERDVQAGEEFFIDYGLTYDQSMYGKGTETLKDTDFL